MLRELYARIPIPSKGDADLLLAEAVPGFPRYRLARDIDGKPALLIQAPADAGQAAPTDVRLRQISLRPHARCRLHTGGSVREEDLAIIQCETSAAEIVALFLRVMSTWIEAVGPAPTHDAIATSFARLARMFECFAMPSRAEVRGTWGELFLTAVSRDPARALTAWHRGPSETYDFADDSGAIEAKTCHGPAHSHIFSLSQLTADGAADALVASLILTEDPDGASLDDLLALIAARTHDPRLRLRALEIVAELLGASWRQAERARFDATSALRSLRFFSVPDIPCIPTATIPREISDVRFRVDLTGLTPEDPVTLATSSVLRGAIVPSLSASELSSALAATRSTR